MPNKIPEHQRDWLAGHHVKLMIMDSLNLFWRFVFWEVMFMTWTKHVIKVSTLHLRLCVLPNHKHSPTLSHPEWKTHHQTTEALQVSLFIRMPTGFSKHLLRCLLQARTCFLAVLRSRFFSSVVGTQWPLGGERHLVTPCNKAMSPSFSSQGFISNNSSTVGGFSGEPKLCLWMVMAATPCTRLTALFPGISALLFQEWTVCSSG